MRTVKRLTVVILRLSYLMLFSIETRFADCQMALEAKRGVLVAVNKWDVVKKTQ